MPSYIAKFVVTTVVETSAFLFSVMTDTKSGFGWAQGE